MADDKLVLCGVVRSLNGESIVIDFGKSGMAEITVKNRKERWIYYTRPVKITIEEVSEKEVVDWMKK